LTRVYKYTTNYQDFVAAQRLIIRSNRKSLIRYYFVGWLLPALGWMAAALVFIDMVSNQFSLPSWGVDLLILFGLWSIMIPLTRHRLFKRRYRQMKNGRSDSDPLALKFTDMFIAQMIPGMGEGRHYRATIEKFVEDDKVALIYTGKLRFLLIPKRAIPQDDWPLIRGWIAGRFETTGDPV
jgi:hypothetical protein